MHTRRTALAIAFGVLGTLGLSQVQAAKANDRNDFYVGLTGGFAAVTPNDFDLKNDSTIDGKFSPGLVAGMRIGGLPIGNGWPLYAELGYQDIRRLDATYKTAAGDSRVATEGKSTYLAARLAWPLTESFDLFARLGVSRNSAESRTLSGPNVINVNNDKTGPLVGIGLEYRFDNGIGLRGDLTSYGKSSSKGGGKAEAVNSAVNFTVAYHF